MAQVLLVIEDAGRAHELGRLLGAAHRPVIARDAWSAVDHLHNDPVDVLICEDRSRRIRADLLVQVAHRLRPDLPVLVISDGDAAPGSPPVTPEVGNLDAALIRQAVDQVVSPAR